MLGDITVAEIYISSISIISYNYSRTVNCHKLDTNLFLIVDIDSRKVSNKDLRTTSCYQSYLMLSVILARAKKVTYHLIVDFQE